MGGTDPRDGRTHIAPAMNSSVKCALVVLLVGLAGTMTGCGCDEDAGKKCTSKGGCQGFADWTKCISDASCCDLEKDGAKMKDAITAAEGLLKLLGCGSGKQPEAT